MYVDTTMLGLIVIALIWLIVTVRRHGKHIARLEARLQSDAYPVPEATAAKSDGKIVGPWARPKSDAEGPDAEGPDVDSPDLETSDADPPDPTKPRRAFVFRADLLTTLGRWVADNWALVIAAVSLVLAGVFLVQYGVENGLLTPVWRVIGALALGAAFIVGGEVIRRRAGDGADSHAAFLPSTFAGAGVVTLFAAVIAARQLYGLIEVEAAFAGLVAVAAMAVAMGWFYGPFLAAVGITGATLAPFAVGGVGPVPAWFFYFYALVGVAGLLIDALRRWAWISVAALILPHIGAWLLFASGGPAQVHYLGFGMIMALAACAIPPLKWTPAQSGAMISDMVRLKAAARGWPEFPTRISATGLAGGVGVAVWIAVADIGLVEDWAAIWSVAALYVAVAIWLRRAPALADLAVLPVLALLAILVHQGIDGGAIWADFTATPEPEAAAPRAATLIVALGLAGSALAFWRSQRGGTHEFYWAGLGAALAPVTLAVLEAFWNPARQIGAYPWALHGMVVAAFMTGFCGSVARTDRRRAALFALAAFAMIAFALIVVLSSTALTLALAVTVLGAAAIDRAFGMRALGLFVQVGTITIGWRLILDPGVLWAQSAPLVELVFGYAGSIALLALAWLILPPDRRGARITLESGVWTLLAVFATVLIFRGLESGINSHAGMGLTATVWLAAMACQLYRLRIGPPFRWVRIVLALLFGTMGVASLTVGATLFNPLLTSGEPVSGPPIFDTLLAAILLPALPLIVVAWMGHLRDWLRAAAGMAAALMVATYVGLEIRRAWRGDDLSVPGVTVPELYSYTVAMLAVGIALLFIAFARRSVVLRRLAMGVIALTIAKVFLIDMSGLSGLIRVASFLGLGLSLAALAWVNRRMTAQWDRGEA